MACRVAWDEQATRVVKRETVRTLCVTWNVNEQKPDAGSDVFAHIAASAAGAQVAVFGLQEIEMGSASVALAAAKDQLARGMQVRGACGFVVVRMEETGKTGAAAVGSPLCGVLVCQ